MKCPLYRRVADKVVRGMVCKCCFLKSMSRVEERGRQGRQSEQVKEGSSMGSTGMVDGAQVEGKEIMEFTGNV